MNSNLHIAPFFDPETSTVSYVVEESSTRCAAIIDPVLDYNFRSGMTSTKNADKILAHVRARSLTVEWIIETHAHADHLSAAAYLKPHTGGKIAIGAHITDVQGIFRKIYHLEKEFLPDGRQFDHLFHDNDTFTIGSLEVTAMHVPGHTPADMAYLVAGEAIFVGDTMFLPDVGTARADFPGGNAHTLYTSIKRILSLPPETRIFVCHDYPPATRTAQWETTVAAQRAANIHVRDGIDEATFVAMRTKRDATLDMPTLILPAIQVNIRAGQLPPPEENGTRYLKIPLNTIVPQ